MTLGRKTIVTAAALIILAATTQTVPPPFLINESPSLPRGLYVRSIDQTVRAGAVVAVQPPAAGRAYLADLGWPNGLPLLKRVAAVGGDRVCARAGAVLTPHGAAPTRREDRRGRELVHWSGCRALSPDEVFLLGTSTASFDSRYFGPVRRSDIQAVFQEVVRW